MNEEKDMSLSDMLDEGLFDFLFRRRRLGARTKDLQTLVNNIEIGKRLIERYRQEYPVLIRRLSKNMSYMIADLGRLKMMIESGETEVDTRLDMSRRQKDAE